MPTTVANEMDPAAQLQSLLIGASISGVRFGAWQLLLHPTSVSGELFVNLSSAFQVFETRPVTFPTAEQDVPEMTEEQEMLSLFSLRGYEVTNAEIINPHGHLVITFNSGAVLYVNGNNSGPEPWHAGLNAIDRADSIWIIALSGDRPIAYKPFPVER